MVLARVEKNGEITLEVYGDITSSEPTHEIPLDGAKARAKKDAPKTASQMAPDELKAALAQAKVLQNGKPR